MNKEVERRKLLRARDKRSPRIRGPGRNRQDAQADRAQRRARGNAGCACPCHGVATGNVAGFVRNHAFDLTRIIRRHDQAGMQVNTLSARNEGVQAWIIDDVKPDIIRLQTGYFQDGVRPFTQSLFDFRVADQALAKRGQGCRHPDNADGQYRSNEGHNRGDPCFHYRISIGMWLGEGSICKMTDLSGRF